MQVRAFDAFGKVFLHGYARDVPVVQTVIPFLQGKSMIPDETCLPEHVVQMFCLLVVV
jgi:hypothetical protein